jgi:hypothetical protein
LAVVLLCAASDTVCQTPVGELRCCSVAAAPTTGPLTAPAVLSAALTIALWPYVMTAGVSDAVHDVGCWSVNVGPVYVVFAARTSTGPVVAPSGTTTVSCVGLTESTAVAGTFSLKVTDAEPSVGNVVVPSAVNVTVSPTGP